MRLAHSWDYAEERPRKGDTVREKRRSYVYLFFDALAVYRDKDAIEKRFGDVKSLLDFRAPRVSAEETLNGKIFVMFVALVLAAWLRRRMQETGLDEEYTLSGLIDEVETVERYTREGHRPRILEFALKQRAVFERLGYEVPATS